MPEQDTPLTPPGGDAEGDDDADFLDPVRDPATGAVDYRASLFRGLQQMVDAKPATFWDAQPWQLRPADDLTSEATGETCAARFVLTHDGTPVARIELRPGQTDSPLGETYGRYDMWYVHLGRRQPRRYVDHQWALAYAMGLRRRDMWDNRYLHEWLTHGDVRSLLTLLGLEDARDRARDRRYEAQQNQWRRDREEREGGRA